MEQIFLSASSTPNLDNASSGDIGTPGYANVLVPQSPSFSAKAGTWTFKADTNDRVRLALRTGSTPSAATIAIQPYITGTTWSARSTLFPVSSLECNVKYLLCKWNHTYHQRHNNNQ